MKYSYLYYGIVYKDNAIIGIKIGETMQSYKKRWADINYYDTISHNNNFVGVRVLTLINVDTITRRNLEDYIRNYIITTKHNLTKYGKDHFAGMPAKSLGAEVMHIAKAYCDKHNIAYKRITTI
jgi:hypothetical protein